MKNLEIAENREISPPQKTCQLWMPRKPGIAKKQIGKFHHFGHILRATCQFVWEPSKTEGYRMTPRPWTKPRLLKGGIK
jgi:hypothetical protein